MISAEGLIGFKLQALVNNPSRTRDLDDIRALLRVQRGKLNMTEVREYFALFDRKEWLDELLAQSPVKNPDRGAEPLAGGHVVSIPLAGKGDLSGWMELMEAVEALCRENRVRFTS